MSGYLQLTNCITGKKIVCRRILNDQKKIAISMVDNSKPYNKKVIIIQERMPKRNDNKND